MGIWESELFLVERKYWFCTCCIWNDMGHLNADSIWNSKEVMRNKTWWKLWESLPLWISPKWHRFIYPHPFVFNRKKNTWQSRDYIRNSKLKRLSCLRAIAGQPPQHICEGKGTAAEWLLQAPLCVLAFNTFVLMRIQEIEIV